MELQLARRPVRRRPAFWLGVFAASALGLAACSGAGANPSTPGTTTAPVVAPATTAPATTAPPSAPASTAPPSTAGGGAAIDVATSNKLGPILTGTGGMTLYTFSPDTATSSACTSAACVKFWPIFTTPAGTKPTAGSGAMGTVGTFTRPDGSAQVTYNGHQLYFFAGDKAAGDTNGQGVVGFGGTWKVATP